MAENLNHYKNLIKYQQEFISTKMEEDRTKSSIERLELRVLSLSKSLDCTKCESSRQKRIISEMEDRLRKLEKYINDEEEINKAFACYEKQAHHGTNTERLEELSKPLDDTMTEHVEDTQEP